MFTQVGDVACNLIVVVAAAIGASIICEYCRKRWLFDAPSVRSAQDAEAAALSAAEGRAPRNDSWRLDFGSPQGGTAWRLHGQKARGKFIPHFPSSRRFLQPYLRKRIETYERRSCNIASVVGGELPNPRVTSRSHELFGAQKMTLDGLLCYTNDDDQRKLADWLEGDRGRCCWGGLAVCYGEDARKEWIRPGEVERPCSSIDYTGSDALPNVEVWKVTGPKHISRRDGKVEEYEEVNVYKKIRRRKNPDGSEKRDGSFPLIVFARTAGGSGACTPLTIGVRSRTTSGATSVMSSSRKTASQKARHVSIASS